MPPRYHEKADVEGLLRQIQYTFTETSTITVTELATYIDNAERYVDRKSVV